MEKNGEFQSRIVSGFIVVCMAMIAASGAYLAQNYLNVNFAGSVFIGVIFFLLLYLLHYQRLLQRELNEFKNNAGEPSDLEGALIRRMDELSEKINSIDNFELEQSVDTILLNCETNKNSILRIDEELLIISRQIEKTTGLNPSAEKPAGGITRILQPERQSERKIVPLHIPKESAELPIAVGERPSFPVHIGQDDFSAAPAALSEISATEYSRSSTGNSENRNLIEHLHHAVKRDELELHLQPIVNLSDREPEFYESTLRLKDLDGTYLDQQRLGKLVRDERLATVLDGQLLFSAIRVLRTLNELQKRTGLFCPVSAATLNNKNAFEDIYAFLAANTALAGSLVLEIEQSALTELNAESRERLSRLVDLGFSLLLDNVQNFDLEGSLLHSAGFRNIKVSVNELLNISDESNIDEYVTDFSEEMESCGLTVIVSEIEHEVQAVLLGDFELPLGQGTLFSPSRPVKPELLNSSEEDSRLPDVNTA